MKRLLFVVLLLAGAAAGIPVAPAQAAACSGTSGVTVVVQFPDRTTVGCAAGDPSTGFAALKGAGFDVTIVTRFPGAVCQINSYPDTSCQNMPPSSAYWTYYQAKPGGHWTKSNYGAASTNPEPGSFEGWRFGDGTAAPDYAIPPAPTPPTTPTSKPTVHPTAAHPTRGASNPVVGPDETPTAPAASSSPGQVDAPTSKPTATATDDSTPTAGPTGTGGAASDPVSAREAAADSSSGSSASWIWGLVLIGVVGAAAAATAVRRRRS